MLSLASNLTERATSFWERTYDHLLAEGIGLSMTAYQELPPSATVITFSSTAGYPMIHYCFKANSFTARSSSVARGMTNTRYRIVVDPERCVGCGSCVRACAYGVLELIDDLAYPVRPSECRGCGDCVKACEQEAIQVLQAARGRAKIPGLKGGREGG